VARRYAPATTIGRRTMAAAAGWAALCGLVAGAAAHAASRVLFPVHLVLPAAVGVAVGAALAVLVRRLRLSRPRAVVALAAGAVVLALSVQLAFDYRAALAEEVRQLEPVEEFRVSQGFVEPDEAAADRAEALAGWTLWRYARARVGLDDSGTFTGMPPGLSRAGTLALSAIELLLGLAIACLWAGRAAAQPACPTCGAWRAEHALGSAAHGVAREVVKRLNAGDAAGAAALLRPPDTREAVALSAFACPAGHDQDGGVLRIGEVFWTRRRRLALRRIADLEVSGEEMAAMTRAVRGERE
jgi:hypothetical protein